jgi:hypothetical protein
MSSRDRRTAAKGVAVNIAVAGVLSVGAAVAFAATAAADPPPPPPGPDAPAPPPAPGGMMNDIGTTLAQAGQGPVGPAGLPLGVFLGPDAPTSNMDFLLSQHQIPALQGTQPAGPPDNSVLGPSGYLLPNNFKLADQGQTSMYSVAPPDMGAPSPGLWDYLRGAHGLWHQGMGRMDLDQLGQPLPGTAPPPGTNLPPGPEQFLPDPPPPPDAPPPPPLPGG